MKRNLIFAFLLFISGTVMSQETKSVRADEFEKGIKSEAPVVLDVRRPDEFEKGHLPDAVNINWQNKNEFVEKAGRLDKSKPIYVYCLAGVRSSDAAEWLVKNGFTKVIDLEGGIGAWKKARKPIVKD